MGRSSKYKKEYCQEIIDYFNREPYKTEKIFIVDKKGNEYEKDIKVPCDLPLLSKFAISIGVTLRTMENWAKTKKEFKESCEIAKQYQEHILVTNGLAGNYNTSFAIFTAKNIIGWRDHFKDEQHGPTEGTKVIINIPDNTPKQIPNGNGNGKGNIKLENIVKPLIENTTNNDNN